MIFDFILLVIASGFSMNLSMLFYNGLSTKKINIYYNEELATILISTNLIVMSILSGIDISLSLKNPSIPLLETLFGFILTLISIILAYFLINYIIINVCEFIKTYRLSKLTDDEKFELEYGMSIAEYIEKEQNDILEHNRQKIVADSIISYLYNDYKDVVLYKIEPNGLFHFRLNSKNGEYDYISYIKVKEYDENNFMLYIPSFEFTTRLGIVNEVKTIEKDKIENYLNSVFERINMYFNLVDGFRNNPL